MSNRRNLYGLIAAGAVLVLASLLVDALGVGTEGFGVGQIAGIIVGILMMAGGYWMLRRPAAGA